jgi:predicted DNA-binding transcriptional regulator AlpA
MTNSNAMSSRTRQVDTHATPALMNEAQTAALLGISPRKLHDIRNQGWFPVPIVLGPRALRWSRDEVMQALAQRAPRQESAQEPAQLRRARIDRMKGWAPSAG